MAWILTTISLVVFLYLLQVVLSLKKKKRLPPGPRGLPILGHLHLLSKNPHQDLYHLAQKHGPIMYMRFGFVPTIVVSSPDAAELILKTHDHVFASRPSHEVSKYGAYGQRNLVFGPHGPYWRYMRKMCSSDLLNNIKINQFQPMRKAEIGLLISSLKRDAEMREIVDLSSRVLGLSIDMLCLMVFGRKYTDENSYEKGFKDVIKEAIQLGSRFNLGDCFPFLGVIDLQGLTRKTKRLSKIIDGFLEKSIDDHILNNQKGKKTRDFVDTLIANMESGEVEFEFDRRHVKAVLLDLLLAGTDTVATLVDWTLTELIRHPTIMKKLQKEIESVVGTNHLVEETHIAQLEYLDFVIKEAMRLHPVAPILVPRESMEDCVVKGFHISKKSLIIVNVLAIMRDPNIWSDPERFSPERFIGNNIDPRGRDFRFIPFGSGRRSCPGMQLALLVAPLVVAQLVHCFDWELPNGINPSELDMSEKFSFATARVEHLMAIPKYRLDN